MLTGAMGPIRASLKLLQASLHVRGLRHSGASPPPGEAAVEGVDAVYLWRDPCDSAWRERRRAVLGALDPEARQRCNLPDLAWLDAAGGRRLESLRWSLRSLARFFPGVGRIHVVADSPRPSWLPENHERLAWIACQALVEPPCSHPSFSSQALESFLSRLPGLRERFLYFNDDFFLRREVGAGDFFEGSRIRVQMGRGLSPKGVPLPTEAGDTSAHKNSNRLLDDTYGEHPRLTVRHRPYALTRSLFAEAERRFPQAFAATRSERFRSIRTHALHSCLVPYMALYGGRGVPVLRPFAKDLIFWGNDLPANARAFRRIAGRGRDPGFCVQGNAEGGFTPEAVAQFDTLMEGLYPEPAPFERCPEP